MEVHTELYLHQLRITPEKASFPATIEGIPLDTIAGFSRYIPFADSSIYQVVSFGLPAKFLLATWFLRWQTKESLAFVKQEIQKDSPVFSFPFTDDGVGQDFFLHLAEQQLTQISLLLKNSSLYFELIFSPS